MKQIHLIRTLPPQLHVHVRFIHRLAHIVPIAYYRLVVQGETI